MPALILVSSEHRRGAYAARTLRRLATQFLETLKLREVELSIVVTTDRRIRRLNREWRDKDQATDVLSFPAGEAPRLPGERRWLGDVVISLDTADRRAKEDKRPLRAELARYLAHGLLHLLGHDHHEPREAARMSRAESRLLGEAGMISAAEAAAEVAPTPGRARRRG